MLILLLFNLFLFIKFNFGDWANYPSPQENAYWKCGVTKPTFVCDPDGLINDDQRKEIVELVENFKEKTKMTKSKYLCVREGIRLIVALSNNYIGTYYEDDILYYDQVYADGQTEFCSNDRKWISPTGCVQGIELNENGIYYCKGKYNDIPGLYKHDYELLKNLEINKIKNKEYFDALKSYIENMLVLYIHRLSVFDKNNNKSKLIIEKQNLTNIPEVTKSEHFNNLSLFGILALSFGFAFLFYKFRQYEKFFKQRNTSSIELIENGENEKNKKQNNEKEEKIVKIN